MASSVLLSLSLDCDPSYEQGLDSLKVTSSLFSLLSLMDSLCLVVLEKNFFDKKKLKTKQKQKQSILENTLIASMLFLLGCLGYTICTINVIYLVEVQRCYSGNSQEKAHKLLHTS